MFYIDLENEQIIDKEGEEAKGNQDSSDQK